MARLRVDRFEPAVHRSVEGDVPRGDERAAPHRKLFFDRPDGAFVDRIPRIEGAAISTRSRIHLDIDADVRSSGDVVRLNAFFVLTQICMRDVEQSRQRRVRARLPIFRTRRRRTDVVNDVAESRRLLLNRDQTTRLQIDAAADGVVVKRRRRKDLAVRAIHYIEIAVALRTQ